MSIDIRYHRKDHLPNVARASYPGEPLVNVSIETLAHLGAKLQQQRRFARPNMLVQMGADGAGLDEAVRAVVDEDRAQGYRWTLDRERAHLSTLPRFKLEVVEASAESAEFRVRCPSGDVYVLWAATLDGLARAAGDGAPFFYAPNLVAVRAIEMSLLHDVAEGLWRDLPRYAVLAETGLK
jgi:hypothetical protein